MVALTTPEVHIGWKAADFSLPATDGKHYSLADVMGEKGLVVMFICNHCPYVISIKEKLVADAQTLIEMGVGVVAINANDADAYPADNFESMQKEAYPFPYLHDETQAVAKAYDAVCTPDFFGFDIDLKLKYRGRLDDSGREKKPDGARELVMAMHSIALHNAMPAEQHPSIGCSIKWKS